ncbi:multidrug efflux RND transporter permease subunit [Luteolibacter yonseiensis]|uniref:Multidrug efflux RND transporter permease subunit n=1 Tax=Luteolibacter yonseiensis TaxID=1144680 RepID=A0A934R369_9BACT|nr:multidrug efflux RND transporter permease subunit [Luteolibacter yonseiensis]MBK1817548.1 multidrug efflux RND transporter permease subunit [Luteolibacter yonseiensis]
MAFFFIKRPIFAWVVSLFIILAGLLSLRSLPVAQYPDIAPPTVNISTSYPGASAQVVEETVTAVIEREMNGAPGLIYMAGTSESTGAASLKLTFKQGTNPDIAAVEVQNRLAVVEQRLPAVVRQGGIRIEKAADNIQLFVSLSSKDPKYDSVALGEIAASRVIDILRRVPGVGQVQIFGAERAMRIWPDPEKLTALQLSASDVVNAVRSNNNRITIGDIGSHSVPESAALSATIVADDSLDTPEEFGDIELRSLPDGSSIKLRDVARIELGGSDYQIVSGLNDRAATGMGVKLAPGSNALEVVEGIKKAMDELAPLLPSGVQYEIPYDTSPFVAVSIKKVVVSLFEAIALVFVVMFLFMQNIRATLIPTFVVPIALLGTFAVMMAMGFSINVLTMFSMVLAIGILVDDAIVVVENVERIMKEEGLAPGPATVKAMKQISGAIIGITVVLVSVFIPMAFFSGAVGNIYRQFALTLSVSIGFSAFLALSLTPALCATMLKPIGADHHEKKGFFGWFNRVFDKTTHRYSGTVAALVRKPVRYLFVFAAIVGATFLMYRDLPSSFLPNEDQGNLMIPVSLPQGATQRETRAVLAEINEYMVKEESAVHSFSIAGFSIFGNGPHTGMIFAMLRPWDERKEEKDHVSSVVARVNQKFGVRPNAMIFALTAPPLPELGSSTSGFDFRLQNRGGIPYKDFVKARDQLLGMAAGNPELKAVMYAGMTDTPQLRLDIDRAKAQAMGVTIEEVNSTLAVMFGSDYVGDFILNGQVRRIIIQADGKHRTLVDDVKKLRVRNTAGHMVEIGTFARTEWIIGPPSLTRYNGFPAFSITGEAAAGKSSGDAMKAMEELVKKLPPGLGYEWSGQSYEERVSGSQAPVLYGLSILIVFLALAALYESWSIPLSVVLAVPLGILGAVAGVILRDMPNDIYFRVGLIAIIGLSSKNAILIVEVAKDLYRDGMGLVDAAVEASRLRLRPIIMTSLAFGIGVVPLAFASGASSGAQNAIGTGVLGGITTATVLAIFFVPVFFVVIGKVSKKPKPLEETEAH